LKKKSIFTSPLISLACYIFVRPLCPSSNTTYLTIIIIFVLGLKWWHNIQIKELKKKGIFTSPLISLACYIFVRPLCPSSNTTYLTIIIIFVLGLKQWHNFKILSYLVNMHFIYLSSSFVLLFVLFLNIVLQKEVFQWVNVKWW
jgi:phosphatidylserine synthase